ncbi:hypothetical protein FVR03_11345 [Pontibacter qinzhouensis]|uniref:Uncharacterized protein n=1 Tax=Pontibacter qinzhouensis TaxID=2603253 RepID=A0A5C8K9U5_9BACT|nr:hypothetical protein [Pontibacter qinzhouensis]TXK45894.1 hypothetical protein FVR03_11345 [Pontibacter qinzhouensis]
MGNFAKSVLLLFFAFLLPWAEEMEGAGADTAQAIAGNTGEQVISASVAGNELQKVQFSPRPAESFVSAPNTPAAPGAKAQWSGLLGASPALEHYLCHLTRQYLARASGICLSLASCDIIFPFHYFW